MELNEIDKIVVNELIEKRKKLHLSQSALAKRCDITRQYLNIVEHHKAPISNKLFKSLCKELKLNYIDLSIKALKQIKKGAK